MPRGAKFGHIVSEESRKKMSLAKKGKPNGLKGKHWKCSEQARINIGKGHFGNKNKPMSEIGKKNISKAKKGTKYSEEHRRKMSESHKGNKCNFWIDGRTPLNIKLRKSFEFNRRKAKRIL